MHQEPVQKRFLCTEFELKIANKTESLWSNKRQVKHKLHGIKQKSLRLSPKQPRVWSVSNFIFLTLAYEHGWPVLSFAVSSFH